MAEHLRRRSPGRRRVMMNTMSNTANAPISVIVVTIVITGAMPGQDHVPEPLPPVRAVDRGRVDEALC